MTAEVQNDTLTLEEVTSVALALVEEPTRARFAMDLPAEKVAPYLAKLLDAKTELTALEKELTRRLIVDGQVGQHWIIENREYGLFGALQKGWKDIPGLFSGLLRLGLHTGDLGAAVSEIRVTDLKKAVAFLSDEAAREEALELIEDSRIPKGERGAPSFKVVVEGRS